MRQQETDAEEWAERLVQVSAAAPGEPWSVALTSLFDEPVLIGTHPNPSVVKDEAKRIRAFVVALIHAARGTRPVEDRTR